MLTQFKFFFLFKTSCAKSIIQEIQMNPDNYKIHSDCLKFSLYEEMQHKQIILAIVIVHLIITDKCDIKLLK